jgi:hypothetical protein
MIFAENRLHFSGSRSKEMKLATPAAGLSITPLSGRSVFVFGVEMQVLSTANEGAARFFLRRVGHSLCVFSKDWNAGFAVEFLAACLTLTVYLAVAENSKLLSLGDFWCLRLEREL